MPAGVLFVHNNFPGQFADLAQTLLARGVPCASIGGEHARGLPGMASGRYGLKGRGQTEGIFPLAARAELDLIRASSALRIARRLKDDGFDPAVIVGHPGWGEMALVREAFPDAPTVMWAEFYYHGRGLDVGFDPEFFPATEARMQLAETQSAVMALSYAKADVLVAPTPFQASTVPAVFRSRLRIIHEGVDTDAIRPGPAAPFTLPDGRIIEPGVPVITHVNRHMEPVRGLHILARALPRVMAEVPDARVILFGRDGKEPYGGVREDGRTWREAIFEGLEIDPARLHLMGRAPHDQMLAALKLGVAHVYYTYPFILSWSLAEAMASGCYVIGSDTPPLHDAIEDGVSGRLLPFFDVDALSDALIAACRDPQASAGMRKAARRTAEAKFSRAKGRAAWLDLLRELGVQIPDDEPAPTA